MSGGLAAGGPPGGRLAVAAGCLVLTFVFFLALFPYERVRPSLEQAASSALGGPVRIGSLGLGLGGMHLEDVSLRRAGAPQPLEIASAQVRPAASLAWLEGVPALRIAAEAWGARARGTARLDSRAPGFAGRLENLDPSALPPALLGTEPPWIGALDADLDLVARGPLGAEGRVDFAGEEGAVTVPGIPFALPFDRVEGALELAEEGILVERLDLEGPMLSGSAQGRIGPGELSRAPLDLELEIRRAEQAVAQMLRRVGITLRGSGATRVHLGGSVASPQVRSAGGG